MFWPIDAAGRKTMILTGVVTFLLCFAPSGGIAGNSSLWTILEKDSEGLYLTHIPRVFSIHAVRIRPGNAYSGTIQDPGGWIHVTRDHDPNREMVLERLSRDTLRFLIAPSGKTRPVGFSFETSTGCFTLRARETPQGTRPRIHLNGYGPPVKEFPVVLCGNGAHVRIEWQGSVMPTHRVISGLAKRGSNGH